MLCVCHLSTSIYHLHVSSLLTFSGQYCLEVEHPVCWAQSKLCWRSHWVTLLPCTCQNSRPKMPSWINQISPDAWGVLALDWNSLQQNCGLGREQLTGSPSLSDTDFPTVWQKKQPWIFFLFFQTERQCWLSINFCISGGNATQSCPFILKVHVCAQARATPARRDGLAHDSLHVAVCLSR